MRGTVAALAVTGTLFGCGGGGGGPEGSGAPVQTVKKTVVIDAEGDSLIWGYVGTQNGVLIQSVNNPPVVLQATLQANISGNVIVNNKAVPGATAADSLTGAPNYGTPFATRLSKSNAQIVLADYMMNDSRLMTTDAYRANLISWIDTVRQAGKTPVLEEANPSCAANHTNLPDYRAIMVDVANQKGVFLIKQYDYVSSLPNWQSMLVDCVHPNDTLYKIKAENEAAQIRQLVSSMM
jgi:lysophospholipase L1-like esterase